MNGKGTINWNDGKKFIGNFKNDLKDGLGFYEWSDGRKFYCKWEKGNMEGIGVYQQDHEQLRVAEFKQGVRLQFLNIN